jgi:GNAT superfamily N-acetyltransferase
MKIRKLETESDMAMGFRVLKELRKEITEGEFQTVFQKASEMDGYTMVGAFIDNELIAVMGYRFLFDFVRKKHLYIDDLVTTESMRSKGIGSKLLKYAENVALDQQCSVVRLCAHIDNKSGQNFYERELWNRRSIAYQKIPSSS